MNLGALRYRWLHLQAYFFGGGERGYGNPDVFLTSVYLSKEGIYHHNHQLWWLIKKIRVNSCGGYLLGSEMIPRKVNPSQ